MQVVPKHIAIIMDGNGRWAKSRGLPRIAGHRAGVESLRKTIQSAAENHVEVLSLFAFSTENWNRPKDEVSGLMALFLRALRNEVKKLHQHNIQLIVIGDLPAFSDKIQQEIQKAIELTANNTGMKLVIAANYGGRWDIVSAVKKIAEDIGANKLRIEDINEEKVASRLALANLPDPDLFIRTSGELRISNFFLWQLAYTEFYFSPVMWPDFNESELQKALDAYMQRQRRFGGVN